MKQFWSVLRFELNGYFKSRIYRVMTILFAVVLMIVLSYPNLKTLFAKPEQPVESTVVTQAEQLAETGSGEDVVAVINQNGALSDDGLVLLANALGTPVRLTADDVQTVRDAVKNSDYAGAVVLKDRNTVTYITRSLTLGDDMQSRLYAAMTEAARYDTLTAMGVSQAQTQEILYPEVSVNLENLGVSQTDTFFYTYIMLMALYMAIMIYGQIVASSVATEKSSRTMELLITSARPNSLLFGKMIAAGLSGLIQMAAIFGSAVLFYHINEAAWAGNAIIASIFNMPLPIVGYVLLFFLLGFFLYAFMYGAVGSLVSRVEDVSASMTPILMCFVFAFIVVINAVSSGNADGTLMVVCSYIPLTSPMAMFARIAMSNPAWYEIVISVALLMGTTVGIGFLSAAIYRMGVLMYGKAPKPSELIKVVRMARTHRA